jgi:hypothetical protein
MVLCCGDVIKEIPLHVLATETLQFTYITYIQQMWNLFSCVLYCSLFLYCTVSACDVRAATLTDVFLCFFLSCKANARV